MTILSAKHANAAGTAILAETDERGQVLIPLEGPDTSNGLRDEYVNWLRAGHLPAAHEVPLTDYIQEAEDHIGQFFSSPKQLMMKVWWDAIPHENLPKVTAVYQWVNATTAMAMQGSRDFTPSPFTFQEVAEECVPLLTQ